MNIEQDRRDFKRANLTLYAYIVAHEVAKALDSAGDACTGCVDGHGAANRVWERASHHRLHAQAMRAEDG